MYSATVYSCLIRCRKKKDTQWICVVGELWVAVNDWLVGHMSGRVSHATWVMPLPLPLPPGSLIFCFLIIYGAGGSLSGSANIPSGALHADTTENTPFLLIRILLRPRKIQINRQVYQYNEIIL